MANQGWNRKLKRCIFNYYPIILLVALALLIIVFIIVYLYIPQASESLNFFLIGFGGLISFFYFILSQETAELDLFSRLYKDFNERYDKLNDALNCIKSDTSGNSLIETDKNLLYDYFNLCSEEYLYYTRGYIYPEVWRAWCNGIAFFLDDKRIDDLWAKEEKSASYYGLSRDEIMSHVVNKE